MLNLKADLDTFIEETTALANSIRVEPMPRTVVEPSRVPSVNWELDRSVRRSTSHRQLQGASAALEKGAGGLRRLRIEADAGTSHH